MTVGFTVSSARDVNPIILPIGSLEDELVKVNMTFKPVEPLMGSLHIGMALVVIPGRIRREWELDISGLSESVLGGVSASNFDVELVAAVAGADDNGAANEAAEGFQDFLAELLQHWNVPRGYRVVDVILFCSCRTFEL